MKVFLVPPFISDHPNTLAPYLTSYVINDAIAIDAGCVGFYGTPKEQSRISHLFLSHTHMDHIASLPALLENTYDPTRRPLTILGSAEVIDSLQRDLFNGRVWPDFVAISTGRAPFLTMQTLRAHETVAVGTVRITPVPVNHVVPTFGFIIEEEQSAIVIVSDTAPTDEIWQRANAVKNLKAVFLEASFPNSLSELAEVSKHMTPAGFGGEVRKLKQQVPVIAVHMKARFYPEVAKELAALGLPQIELARYGEPIEF